MVSHPGQTAAAALGMGLTAVSGAGEGLGGLLDMTVAGAAAGVPINALSAAGIATGVGITGTAMANIASHAAGDDHVEPLQPRSGESEPTPSEEPPFQPPKEVSGRTAHGESQIQTRDGHGVNDAAIDDAVHNPIKPPKFRGDQYGGTYRYVGKDAAVNLNEQGEVTTAWARTKAGWRRP